MRVYRMTWEGAKSRWRKMFKGTTYTISCKELGCPPTKAESYSAANAWWAQKHAQLQGYRPALDTILDIHRYWQEWATENRIPQVAESQERAVQLIQSLNLPPGIADRMADAMGRAMDQPEKETKTDTPGETIGTCVAHWLDSLRSRVEFHKLSPDRYSSYRNMITRFQQWAGQDIPIAKLKEDMVEKYYHDIGMSYKSDSTRATHLITLKMFIRHVYGRRLIELPRNLTSSELRFSIHPQSITTFSINQIKMLLEKATGQTKLHILLALNCGIGGSDIATLSQDDIDWDNGVITRKRSKTRTKKNVPTVSYRLWSQTLALLKEFNSGQTPVLTTETGAKWAGSELRDGTTHTTSRLAYRFKSLARGCGIEGSHYDLRKTSATLLESHPVYGRYVSHFLGHAPSGMATRHYAAPSPELFDTIMAWLGEQYGM
jgi:integrase